MTTADAILTVHMDGIRAGHQAVLAAVADLQADLRRSPELGVRESHTSVRGTKGTGVDLVVTLASSSSLATLARIIRLWLSRDQKRSLTLTVKKGETTTTITVEGDRVSTENLVNALSTAAELEVKK